MGSLRERFTDLKEEADAQEKISGGSPEEKAVAKRFAKLAKTLKKDIDKRISKKNPDTQMIIELGCIGYESSWEAHFAASAFGELAGYRELHRLCADKDIDMKIEWMQTSKKKRGYVLYYPVLVIHLNAPYAHSSEAKKFSFGEAEAEPEQTEGQKLIAAFKKASISPEEVQDLLAHIAENYPGDLTAAANPAAVSRDMRAPKLLVLPKATPQ
jgi:hypothetical protein